MRIPEHYVIVDVANGDVVGETGDFLAACAKQHGLEQSTHRVYRIDLAEHRR